MHDTPTRWNKAWLGSLVLTPLSTVLVPLSGDTTPRLTRHDFIQQTLQLIAVSLRSVA